MSETCHKHEYAITNQGDLICTICGWLTNPDKLPTPTHSLKCYFPEKEKKVTKEKKHYQRRDIITVTVKKTWKGCVSVRDYMVNEALRTGRNLRINYGDESMIVPFEEIEERISEYSKKFTSKVGSKDYHLIDFRWQPDTQSKLNF